MKTRKWIWLSVVIIIVAVIYQFVGHRLSHYRTFASPDGQYRIVVMRKQPLLPMLPGQGSDAPGTVTLYDADNNALYHTTVEMVQLVEDVQWSAHNVTIKLIADWPLPVVH